MPYILMKIFEESPRRFDLWTGLLTMGRLQEVREQIAAEQFEPGARVLDVGCGTGALAALLAERGAQVTGIDNSAEMLAVARERAAGLGPGARFELKELSALQLEDKFAEETFDHIVNILVLSEMSDDEIDCVLLQCRRLLRSRGRLVVVDEVEPKGTARRWALRALRYPARLATYLILQAKDLKSSNIFLKILYYVIELPLMLLTFFIVPPATHPIRDLEVRVQRAGFRIASSETFLGGTLRFLRAERVA